MIILRHWCCNLWMTCWSKRHWTPTFETHRPAGSMRWLDSWGVLRCCLLTDVRSGKQARLAFPQNHRKTPSLTLYQALITWEICRKLQSLHRSVLYVLAKQNFEGLLLWAWCRMHQQKKHSCRDANLLLLTEFHTYLGLMRKLWCMLFSELPSHGVSFTCTCIPICTAISLQYICVSSRLRQEHEKWRWAQSSVPWIGAVQSSVNGFCVCISISICFHHLWKAGMTSLPTGAARAPCTFLHLFPITGLICQCGHSPLF